MKVARVIGNVVSSVKLPLFEGRKLLLAKPLDVNYQPTGEVVLAIDLEGAGPGEIVLLSDEGKAVADLLFGGKRAPARTVIIGILDPRSLPQSA